MGSFGSKKPCQPTPSLRTVQVAKRMAPGAGQDPLGASHRKSARTDGSGEKSARHGRRAARKTPPPARGRRGAAARRGRQIQRGRGRGGKKGQVAGRRCGRGDHAGAAGAGGTGERREKQEPIRHHAHAHRQGTASAGTTSIIDDLVPHEPFTNGGRVEKYNGRKPHKTNRTTAKTHYFRHGSLHLRTVR